METPTPPQEPQTPAEQHPTEGLPEYEKTRHDALQAESDRYQAAVNALAQEHGANVSQIEDAYTAAAKAAESTPSE